MCIRDSCSALSVLYTDDGIFDQYLFLPSNPNLVLLDTDIIAAAPARLLVSGMGDALATFFEARAVSRSNSSTCAGGKVTKAALALAELCYDTLISDGLKAKLAVENHVCTCLLYTSKIYKPRFFASASSSSISSMVPKRGSMR